MSTFLQCARWKDQFKKYGTLDIKLSFATIPIAGGAEDVLVLTLAAGEPVLIDQLGLTTHNKDRLEKKVSSLIVYLMFAGLLALPKLLGCIQLLSFSTHQTPKP